MKNIKLTVIGSKSFDHIDSPVFAGVPFPKGELNVSDLLSIKLPTHKVLLPQVTPLAFWPDGSIRWARVDFQCTAIRGEEVSCVLSKNDITLAGSRPDIRLTKQGEIFKIETGVAEFHLDVTNNRLLQKAVIGDNDLCLDSSIVIDWSEGGATGYQVENIAHTGKEASYRLVVTIEGRLHGPGRRQSLKFRCDLTFFANKSFVCCDLNILNPNAALHKDGFWDLGDPGSIFFKRMVLSISSRDPKLINWKIGPDKQWQKSKDVPWKIHQVSSGGEYWQSKNHLIHDRTMPLPLRGFKCYSENSEIENGLRAEPRLSIETRRGPVLNCYLDKFWQNFPSSLSIENDKLEVGFFPKQDNYLFELQAGESKKQTVFIGIDLTKNEIDACASFPSVVVDSNSFYEAQAMPWFTSSRGGNDLDNLIQQGIEGENSFFEKRERADEYGWRNYGDLWADHETIEHGNDDSLVSHYNNQYDPLYSFAHQYALSGDPRWLELLDDLASHVVDIDIYKTDADKSELNYGLFWHTDHYIDAVTSTHRSFSRQHLQTDHVVQSGGGPGSEHCYSTGLVYHYFLTGNEKSRDAALKMTDWMIRVMDGSGSIFERIRKVVTRDLKMLNRLKQGEKILDHKYPLSRGTGNYINTALDAYLLTADTGHLIKVDLIIRNTIHPKDDIRCRNLDDIEANWSYTILLQAVSRYLFVKSEENDYDNNFEYARDCLIHYVSWMLKNENFYLDKPERLEYPNSTWAAQEVRKAFLFYVTSQLVEDGETYKLEGDRYLHYTVNFLKDDIVLKSTRILAILMQSYGPQSPEAIRIKIPDSLLKSQVSDYENPKFLSVKGILLSISKDLLKSIQTFSLKREYEWLKFRI